MSEKIEKITAGEIATTSNLIQGYLQKFSLPTDNIIASTSEREVIAKNIEDLVMSVPEDVRKDARYLSKFIVSSSVGLFDAALNYIWNEVILLLRQKASLYGIELFFDASVGGKARALYNDESDLDGIKDQTLLDTCKKLELISEVTYNKLDHILRMRNDIAASHPNVEIIGGYELLGWLQTCLKDVLMERPSESAIKIKAFISNLVSLTAVIDGGQLKSLEKEIDNLSIVHVDNLVITLFGIYVSNKGNTVLQKNASLLFKVVWNKSSDKVKLSVGKRIDGYRNSLENEKLEQGIELLKTVNGRKYESLSSRIVELDTLAESLYDKHISWDNYYHEPQVMKEILAFIEKYSDIPDEVKNKLIKVVFTCRLGRGLRYKKGVSPSGLPLYDKFLASVVSG